MGKEETMLKVFLIIHLFVNGQSLYMYQHEIENMETCLNIIKGAKLDLSHGDESEGVALMYCAPTLADKSQYRFQQKR